jgi:undecaprenyl diphosphate synthase
VALISDGNARWARARGLSIGDGHDAAADTVIARLLDAIELGIEELTVYTFSTENWSRPVEEVRGLMSLLARRIAAGTPQLHEQGVRIHFIGRRERVAGELLEEMRRAQALTESNRRIALFVAVNYGGRAEIVDAARRFGGSTERDFRAMLYAPEMHDPELIIRTGGERRLSNYLLWRSARSCGRTSPAPRSSRASRSSASASGGSAEDDRDRRRRTTETSGDRPG